MVGSFKRPDAVIDDFGHVGGFVLVELFLIHDAQPGITFNPFGRVLEVIQDADGRIQLPDVVRVAAGQLHCRSRSTQLVRVQAVLAQGADNGAGRQRHNLTGGLIKPSADDQTIIAQAVDGFFHAEGTLARPAYGFHQGAGNGHRLLAGQRGITGVRALFSRLLQADGIQFFEQCGT